MINKMFFATAMLGSEWVLILLILISVLSLAIIFHFIFLFNKTGQWNANNPLRLRLDKIHWDLKGKTIKMEDCFLLFNNEINTIRLELEKLLPILATIGSNAPFVGLLGTVLGIIQVFHTLGTSNSGLQGIMSGVSEALVATAVGLFVAIPAVVAFNFFRTKTFALISQLEIYRDQLLVSISQNSPNPKDS